MYSYCSLDYLTVKFKGIDEYIDQDTQKILHETYRQINKRLEAMGYPTPIGTYSDGDYDPDLKDLNAYLAIHEILTREHIQEYTEVGPPEWIEYFKNKAESIWDSIRSGETTISYFEPISKNGISKPTVGSSNKGSAIFHNNWEGFGSYYTGTDFERTFVVQIIGTGTNNDIAHGTYKWSRDGGFTWEGSSVCNTEWTAGSVGYLVSGVYIRWENGGTGTNNQVYIGNRWTFSCKPLFEKSSGVPDFMNRNKWF